MQVVHDLLPLFRLPMSREPVLVAARGSFAGASAGGAPASGAWVEGGRDVEALVGSSSVVAAGVARLGCLRKSAGGAQSRRQSPAGHAHPSSESRGLRRQAGRANRASAGVDGIARSRGRGGWRGARAPSLPPVRRRSGVGTNEQNEPSHEEEVWVCQVSTLDVVNLMGRLSPGSGHDRGTSAVSSCYTAMAMTGLNDSVRMLKRVDKHPLLWGTFADAKANIVNRAENLRKYLDSAGCECRMHSESGDHHYEASFEYGPPSLDQALPFKMAFHVYRCSVRHGQVHAVEL